MWSRRWFSFCSSARMPSSRSSTASSCRSSNAFRQPRCDSTVSLVACSSSRPSARPAASIATSKGEAWRPRTNAWCTSSVTAYAKPIRKRRQLAPERAVEQQREDRVLGRVRALAQHRVPDAEVGPEARHRGEGEDHGRPEDDRAPDCESRGSSSTANGRLPPARRAVREPGASPGRSRRCEGRRSRAELPLAPRAGKAAPEGAPSQKTCLSPANPNPSRKEDSCQGVSLFSSPSS